MRFSILTDTFPPDINGVALTIRRLALELANAGDEVEVVRPQVKGGFPVPGPEDSKSPPAYELLECPGLPLPFCQGVRFALPQKRLLKSRWSQHRPDAIYVATEGLLGHSALRVARELDIPVASGFHTHFEQYLDFYHLSLLCPIAGRYLKRFHNRTACTLVPTQKLVASFSERGYRNVHRLGRGVDITRFTPAKRNDWVRQQWGVGPEDPVALYVGRVAPEKNVPLALEAFADMREIDPALKMVVVGDGPVAKNLARRHPEVIWAGSKRGEVLASFYASADLFLFPSETDTFGNVVLEALASGLVTIAFDDAAAAELITDGQSGFTVGLGDREGFREAACRALSQRQGWLAIRRAAREVAMANSWDAIIAQFQEHLTRVARPAPGLVGAGGGFPDGDILLRP